MVVTEHAQSAVAPTQITQDSEMQDEASGGQQNEKSDMEISETENSQQTTSAERNLPRQGTDSKWLSSPDNRRSAERRKAAKDQDVIMEDQNDLLPQAHLSLAPKSDAENGIQGTKTGEQKDTLPDDRANDLIEEELSQPIQTDDKQTPEVT
tara:strand:+ start:651 stop:1106 length:456 start_codon:yes stop_codon:yes gene_type:complete